MKIVLPSTVITMLWAIYDQDSEVSLQHRVRAIEAIANEFCVAVPDNEALATALATPGLNFAGFCMVCKEYMQWPLNVF